MIGFVSRLPWCVLVACMGGCASRQLKPVTPQATGVASWRLEEPRGTQHYKLALGSVSSGATWIQRVSPVYPPGLLAVCPLPQEVKALVIVDNAGKVKEVRVADEAQADDQRKPFIAAVRAAALQWDFAPLKVDHWAADAAGNSHVVDSETLPFSLAYVFRFECHAGKASVSTGANTG